MVKYSRKTEWDSAGVSGFESRAFRAGVVAGVLSLVALFGVVQDLIVLLKLSGGGRVAFGFLMIRSTRLERVWFGYRLNETAAYFATIAHLFICAAAVSGLLTRRRWGWILAFAYVLYLPLSQLTFTLLSSMGYLTHHPYTQTIVRAEWSFFAARLSLELLTVFLLWRYRDFFAR